VGLVLLLLLLLLFVYSEDVGVEGGLGSITSTAAAVCL